MLDMVSGDLFYMIVTFLFHNSFYFYGVYCTSKEKVSVYILKFYYEIFY